MTIKQLVESKKTHSEIVTTLTESDIWVGLDRNTGKIVKEFGSRGAAKRWLNQKGDGEIRNMSDVSSLELVQIWNPGYTPGSVMSGKFRP